MYATDKDAGNNGKVRYSIVQDSSGRGFFRIEHNTGWIKVNSAMSGVRHKATMTNMLTTL